jgi:DNA replication protein DnaC
MRLSIEMTYSEQHYGEGDPDCPICGGVGYVSREVPESHPDFGKAFRCSCRAAELTEAKQAYLRKLGGLEHLAHKTFETFIPEGIGQIDIDRAQLQRIYERTREFAENPQGWLVLRGGYGCGKTHLAAAIANAQIELGRPVLFMTVPDLLDYLKASYGPGSTEIDNFSTRIEQIQNVPLLILDDMGTESPTPWAMEKLYQILNQRYMAQLPTVVSTNKELEEFDPRIQSRLADMSMSQIFTITAPDYRQAGTIGASTLDMLGLFHDKTFAAFRLDRALPKEQATNLKKAYEIARQFAQNIHGPLRPLPGLVRDAEDESHREEKETIEPWLILAGVHGCGKTHLAAAIANEQRALGAGVIMTAVPDLLDHLRATFSPNSPVTFDARFQELKTARLLILDNLGVEAATPWAKAKLFQLFDYRYVLRLPTIVTTIYALEEIEPYVDPGLEARMRDKRISRFFTILAPAYLGERQRSAS